MVYVVYFRSMEIATFGSFKEAQSYIDRSRFPHLLKVWPEAIPPHK